jgi:hypothetical protein
MANLAFGVVFCFASLLFLPGETQIWPGDLRVVGFGCFCFCFSLMICPFLMKPTFHAEFSNLHSLVLLSGPSLRAILAATEEKKVRIFASCHLVR